MFFNEANLYLENEVSAKPMTDDEIQEAVEEAEASGTAEIQEGHEFYTIALEAQSILDESYYNLREKMMNVEHVAALKEAQGLYSESEMLLEASVEGFIDKVKEFFKKLKNLIKNLFNKFVNFIIGLSVSVKDIRGVDVGAAWKAFKAKNPGKVMVNVTNLLSRDLMTCNSYAKDILSLAEASYEDLANRYKSLKKSDADDFEKTLSRPTKFRDRVYAKGALIEAYLVGMTEGGKSVVTKHETELKSEMFADRVKFVDDYKHIVNAVKDSKDKAHKALDKAIKKVEELKGAKEHQKKVQGKVIAEMRWMGSMINKIFSKEASLNSTYYRESLAICRRVMGTVKNEKRKENFNKLTQEGYDFSSYFA